MHDRRAEDYHPAETPRPGEPDTYVRPQLAADINSASDPQHAEDIVVEEPEEYDGN